jgi:hypothetical protein
LEMLGRGRAFGRALFRSGACSCPLGIATAAL